MIPENYSGLMGVPVSFIKHYNPHQFQLFFCTSPLLHGKELFERIFIKNREPAEPVIEYDFGQMDFGLFDQED